MSGPQPPGRGEVIDAALDQLPGWLRRDATWATTEDGVLDDSESDTVARVETAPEHALLIGSKVVSEWGVSRYRLILDLDREAVLLPSSTPGHYHLAVDVRMTKAEHDHVLHALADAGVIQHGFADSGVESTLGSTMRPPWVKKGEDKTLAQQNGWPSPDEQAVADALEPLSLEPEDRAEIAALLAAKFDLTPREAA